MKILIIGSKGMAGHIIKHFLSQNLSFVVEDISRDKKIFNSTYEVDVRDFNSLREILNNKFNVVVNCIGVLNQFAEKRPDQAILLNSYLPHFLAEEGDRKGFKLIQISTDCVFSGEKGNYLVTDPKDGKGFYAQSKALGEVTYKNHLTLRTSIIGPELKDDGIGLFHWFMNQSGEIKGFTKAYWTGVTTLVLAKAINSAIEEDLNGLYQLVNNKKISKKDLLELFKEEFNKQDISIMADGKYVVDKSLVNEREDFDFEVPSYKSMIREMKEWMEENPSFYQHYFQ